MINRRWSRTAGLILVALAPSALFLAACGESEKSVAPPATNPFDAVRVGADSTLEVMTWNIENFPKYTAASANYVEGTSTTIDWAKQIIEGLQPDIVAVEEIANVSSFDNLAAQLDGWDGVRRNTDAYQNLGFLFRVDGGLQHTASYEIMASEENTFMRIPFVLEATWNGIPIVVIVVHLKAQESGTADETKRRESCLMLEEFVQVNYSGMRVFIVGDMNDVLTDSAPDNVFQNFLDAPQSWRFADMAIAQGPSGGWSYPGWPSHLDHILVTDEVFPALDDQRSSTTVVPLQMYIPGGWSIYDGRVSDHLPVVVRLQP